MENKQTDDQGVIARMPQAKLHRLLGEMVSLMLQSTLHRSYLINDIGAVILPAINANQFRVYRSEKGPVGFVTWAWLTEPVEKKYVSGKYNLRPEDWAGGDRGWVIDFIAPFGHTKKIVHDLKHNVFPDEIGKAIRIGSDGKVKGIWKLHGVNRIGDTRGITDDLHLPDEVVG
ncbi:MAG: toxin-activating lysine-acyltransferase [Sedimenticola sp.]